MGCSCNGFGDDAAVSESTQAAAAAAASEGLDPAALSQLVVSDQYGRISWKPEMVQLITQMAAQHYVAQEFFSDWPVGDKLVRVIVSRVVAVGEDEDPPVPPTWGTDAEPMKAIDYLTKMAELSYNACASYGWAIPTTQLEKYLIHLPAGNPEALRVASMASPILSARADDMAAAITMPGGSKEPSGWAGLSTGKKVAVIGGGVALLAALGAFGAKYKLIG